MPWWIWLVLAAVMAASLALGVVVALRSGFRALHALSATSDDVSSRLGEMSEPAAERKEREPAPFAQPLRLTAARYENARVAAERRRRRRSDRHLRIWKAWMADGADGESDRDATRV